MSSSASPSTPGAVTPSEYVDYAALINRIRVGDQIAIEELTRLFSRGIRFLLSRQLQPADVERGVQNICSAVLLGIGTNEVGEPADLLSFILATVKRERANLGRQATWTERPKRPSEPSRNEPAVSPRSQALERATAIIEEELKGLSETERDALMRYYLDGEMPESIQSSTTLSAAEFQRITAKIKSRFRSSIPSDQPQVSGNRRRKAITDAKH